MARNKKKSASALPASLTRVLFLSVFLCFPYAIALAAPEGADQEEPAAISPVIAEEKGLGYSVPGYTTLACETGPARHQASDEQNSEDSLSQKAAESSAPAQERPEKTLIEPAQNAQNGAEMKEDVFIQLTLLPQEPLAPVDCAYSAELDEILTAMSAATTAPLITTRGLHNEAPGLSNARPFPTEDPAPIKSRLLERFFAKHMPPVPISSALASCPAAEFAAIPTLRVPKAAPMATIAPIERPVIAKAEPIKKQYEPPFVSDVMASCAYAELINLPIMRTEKRIPLASIAPAEKPGIAKTEPIKKQYDPPFVSDVLASCTYAELINLPVMRTEKRIPLASIAPAAPAPDRTYASTPPKTDNIKIKPEAAPRQPATRPDGKTALVKTTLPKQDTLGAKLTKITPIAPETVESMPRRLLQEERPSVAKPSVAKIDQPAPKAGNTPSLKITAVQVTAAQTPHSATPITKPQTAEALPAAPKDNRLVVAKLAPPDATPAIEPMKPQPPKAPPIEKLVPGYLPPDITRGDIDEKRVSFTFDGGSEDADAAVILSTLKSRGIKATIFLTGEFIQKYPDVVRVIVAEGHEVGNHTMTHPHLTTFETNHRHKTISGVTKATLRTELRGAADAFKAATGLEMAPLWRAPYGEVNEELRKWAFEEGYTHIGWTTDRKAKQSLDTLDWVADKRSKLYRSASEIKRRLLSFGEYGGGVNGGIVLMHLGTQRTADRASEMLGDVIDELSMQGYQIVNISSLMRGHAALEAVYRMRKERVLSGVVLADDRTPSEKSVTP